MATYSKDVFRILGFRRLLQVAELLEDNLITEDKNRKLNTFFS